MVCCSCQISEEVPELAWSDIPWSDPRWLDLRPLMYNAAENAEVRMGRHYLLSSSSTILLHTVTTSGVRHEHVEEVPVLESCWLLQPAAVPAGNV